MNILHRSKGDTEQLAHVTREMYKQNLELAERNKTLTLLRRIDEIVLGSSSEVVKPTQLIADLLVEESDFSLSMIYAVDKEKTYLTATGMATQAKTASDVRDMLSSKLSTLSLESDAQGVIPRTTSVGKIHLSPNFSDLNPDLPLSDNEHLKTAFGTETLFICPLKASNRLLGLLVLGVAVKGEGVSLYQQNLVDRLTGTISIAVENRLLYEELQEATARLQVQNRKLKELDQTKDEFISMASHQLRTPLTAVKGYLSMVLEGDTGVITKNQKELLERAFNGAQNMVYLIADLLNVSRLQTGKFVIENKPTDLAVVVEKEVAQLQATAASRKLTLNYRKPSDFPILSLDENKIRQVVMNFIDNAIYYTPAGGSIDVALSQTPDSVTYTVTDSGLGVPVSEQPHLFTKFYRAGNARKMRPDGTGLGLYMAKKVIAAQGGAIIFKSTEGKGSIFGFSFPLSNGATKQ